MKNIKHFKIILSLLVFFIFILMIFSNIMYSDYSITIFSYDHFKGSYPNRQMLSQDFTINNTFKSIDNNLGIITIKLISDNLIEGEVTFKLREINNVDWLFTNKYDSREFYYLSEYPIGFDEISMSKDKEYEYELSFKKDNKFSESNIFLDNTYLLTSYNLPKNELLHKPILILSLFNKKLQYSLNAFESIKTYIFYTFLFLISLIVINTYKSILSQNIDRSISIIHIYFTAFIIDIFIIHKYITFIPLVLIAIFLFKTKKKELLKKTYIMIKYFIIIAIPTIIFNQIYYMEKIVIYVFYLLIIYTVTSFIELKKKNE